MVTDSPGVERLVDCDKFVLDRWQLDAKRQSPRDSRFHILAIVEGCVSFASDEGSYALNRGHSLLVAASTQNAEIFPQGRAVLLDMYLP
jgi:mannose-6-phosphate isomerase class I